MAIKRDYNFAMKKIIILFCALTISVASADTWVDEDGDTLIRIEKGNVTIFSLGSFYFFDQIFMKGRGDKEKLNLCLGFDEKDSLGHPIDCFNDRYTRYNFYNKGKNRAILLSMGEYPFVLKAFEGYIENGVTMRLSIDNGDLYAGYKLNKKFRLTRDAQAILDLPH